MRKPSHGPPEHPCLALAMARLSSWGHRAGTASTLCVSPQNLPEPPCLPCAVAMPPGFPLG